MPRDDDSFEAFCRRRLQHVRGLLESVETRHKRERAERERHADFVWETRGHVVGYIGQAKDSA